MATELARACVVAKIFTPNNAQPQTKCNPILPAEVWNVLKARPKPGTLPVESEPDPNNTTSGRDITGNCKEYWTVRIVMVSKYPDNTGGGFVFGTNTILICYEWLKSIIPSLILSAMIERVILHEIGHTIIDSNHQLTGIMQNELDPFGVFIDDDLKKIQENSRARN